MLRPTVVLICLIAGLAVPAAASAVTVEKDGSDIFVVAAAGENNELQITQSAAQIVIHDDANPVSPIGGGCFLIAGNAHCPNVGVDHIYVDVGDGTNDVNAFAPYPTNIDGTAATSNDFDAAGATQAVLNGSPGPDTFIGGDGNDQLNGGAGSDVISGRSGQDNLVGGPDNDTLAGNNDADDIQGNGGVDTVDYSTVVNSPLTVSLDDVANDGRVGEGDNVRSSVDNVIGAGGADKLTGSSAANKLEGKGGNDTIRGGGGDDTLNGDNDEDEIHGDAGDDTIHGGDHGDDVDGGSDEDDVFGDAGVDEVAGGFDDDVVKGGTSGDSLLGGRGNDELDGEAGSDTLEGNAGADKLVGGSGSDEVSYANYTESLTVDLDGSNYDDGIENEGDSVAADVEGVIGGAGPDRLTGTAVNQKFIGGAGDDVIDDGGGVDIIVAGAGTDTISALDGMNDNIDCGGDFGTLNADPGDTIANCPVAPPAPEQPAAPGGSGDPGAGGAGGPAGPGQTGGSGTPTTPLAPGLRPALAIGPRVARLSKKRELRIKLTCSGTATANCVGTLRLTRKVKGKTVTYARARYSIAPGKSRTLKLRLSKKSAKMISRRGVKITATATATGTTSGHRTTARTLTLKRR